MNLFKLLCIGLASLTVSACLSGQPDSQLAASDDDYGIGGTGIIGSITGFGSIFVTGIEIDIDEETVVTVNGQAAADYAFNIGETVELITHDRAQHTRALTLNIRHEIIGPVDDRELNPAEISILGQRIILADNSADGLRGQTAAVSGYRDSRGVIWARRVDVLKHDTVLLRGQANQLLDQIHSAGYHMDDSARLQSMNGSVLMTGRIDGSAIELERIDPQPIIPFDPLRHWRIEGFAQNYEQLWPELKQINALGREDQPKIFEIAVDEFGRTSVQSLDLTRLPRGSTQYRTPASQGFRPSIQRMPSRGKGPGQRGK